MKKHELKANYDARTVELLSAKQKLIDRSKAANEVLSAEEHLRRSTLAAIDTAHLFRSELLSDTARIPG
jgi:hypothetical protein